VFPIIKTVHKGDVVSQLAIEVYGFSNRNVIKLLQAHNPQIKNLNHVTAGDTIIFPDLNDDTKATN
jgi:nucleoid-associated protein YgaU